MNSVRHTFPVLFCLLGTSVLFAQSDGVAPRWDVKEQLGRLVEQTKEYDPLLGQVSPHEWMEQGAPDGYVKQLELLRNEISYLQRSALELQRKPDRLSKTLEVFLRIQSVEAMVGSMTEAVSRYQNPALADLLQSVTNDVAVHSQHLRDYLVELVNIKESEFAIADQEAQRCRSQLIQGP